MRNLYYWKSISCYGQEISMFKRKAYEELLEWKRNLSKRYAALLEGPRRVGKSTIAQNFAKSEYESCIVIDFASITAELMAVFEDLPNLDMFFLRLQAQTGISLQPGKSVIVFDEIQLAPHVRQAIKYLVKDGRYDYIETGSLISIKKNVKGIVIPSEEHRISVHPMDYEEFCWARENDTYSLLSQIAELGKPVGNATNRTLMRDFRIYMAVGGMPQSVEAFVDGKSFEEIDQVKREIIELYKADFKKIDPSGRTSAIFEAIPAQLAAKRSQFRITAATGKQRTTKDEERLFDVLDSKTVSACYNVTDPNIPLAQTMELDSYKLYLADTGLFVTMLFGTEGGVHADIYKKLLSDRLEANLGYLYENAVAQAISSCGKRLYYHFWTPEGGSHPYEIDFLLPNKSKIAAIEVKSSSSKMHKSIDAFRKKYSRRVSEFILFSQKDMDQQDKLKFYPVYLAALIVSGL